ncbi:hypothetical protein B0H13DRAFT_2352019 [Mycena leptocephala]|nr:hypothetical protein B0H13DRAFT_2352019 [Mycena leptocephala]
MDSTVSFDVNTTVGALEIGILVSYVLFGVTTTQTYIYYSRFPHDPKKLKALVAFVWVCEMAHALCLGYTLYVDTISEYAHPERVLGAPPKSFTAAIFLSGLIGTCVQAFFSFRIYGLSKTLYIPILTWGMAFLRLVLNAVIFFEVLGLTSVDISEEKWQWLLTATWSISAANDLTVTAALAVLLFRQRRTAHKRTAAVVDKLILWTIETGMLTSSASVVMLACYATMKHNFIWAGVFSVVPRLFSNTLLASLNSRTILRALNEAPLSFSMPSSTPGNGLPSRSYQITKVTQVVYDGEASYDQSDHI